MNARNLTAAAALLIGAYLVWAARKVAPATGAATSGAGYIAVGYPQPYGVPNYGDTLDGPSSWESSGEQAKACGGYTRGADGKLIIDICY